jgi:protein FrlC
VNFSVDEAIRRVARAGFDGIDIWGGRPHVYRQDFNAQQLAHLRQLLESTGLRVPSFMPAFFRYPYNLSSPNETVRLDSVDYMRMSIDNAAALGAELVLIVPGRSLHGQSKPDALARLIHSVREICTYARRYSLRLAIEAVNHYVSDLVNSAAAARHVIDQVDCHRLGIVLDTGHINLGEESMETALALTGDRLYQVHVNDNNGRRQQNLMPGDGTFDFERFFRLLTQHGYDGYLTAELGWEYTLDPDPAVQQIARVLQNLTAARA